MELKLELVSDLETFRSLRLRWDRLVQASSRATYFATWNWLFTWWSIYRNVDMQLRIYCIYANNRLIAILPLYAGRSRKYNLIGFTWLRFLGTGENEEEEVSTEYSDVICLDERVDEVIEFLRFCLTSGQIKWDKLIFERVLDSSLIIRLLQDSTDSLRWLRSLAGVRYIIDIEHGLEACKNGFDPTFRKKVEYYFRRIEHRGNYVFSLTTDHNRIADDLESLRELHTLRWRNKGRTGAFTSKKFLDFHREQMNYLMDQDGLYLLKLSHLDEDIAMLYAIGYKNRFHYYQSGFESTRYKSIAPGHLTINKSIEIAVKNRYKVFDFMLGSPHSYKRDYGCQTETMYNLKVYNQGSRSRLLLRLSTLGNQIAKLGRTRHTEPTTTL